MANILIDPKQLLAEWEQLQAEFQRLTSANAQLTVEHTHLTAEGARLRQEGQEAAAYLGAMKANQALVATDVEGLEGKKREREAECAALIGRAEHLRQEIVASKAELSTISSEGGL